MVEAGFERIGTYVTRRQNTVAQYIATRPILDLCERSAWRRGVWVFCRWQRHDGLYLEGKKKRAAAEPDREEAIIKEEGMPHGNDNGPGMRAGVQSSNLTYSKDRVQSSCSRCNGLEYHHPIMSMIQGHVGRPRRRRIIISTYIVIPYMTYMV